MTWFNHGPRGSRLNRERQIGINRWIGGKKRRKASGRAFLLEGLERRELLAFAANVNFQPAGRPVPSGYVADTGDAFGQRSNGMQYGWNAPGVTTADRWTSADDLHDTLAAMQWQGNYSWEIAVPNGSYQIHIVAGDANSWNDLQRINAENVTVVDGRTTANSRWVEGTAIVTVSDGRLTLSSPSPASRNAIDFVDITSTDGTTTPPDP